MVAMAIMGISIAIFFNMIGNSSKLRGRIDEHTRLVLLAKTKTEEAFLGIPNEKYTKTKEGNVYAGTTKDGIPWEVRRMDTNKETQDKTNMSLIVKETGSEELLPQGAVLLNTQVGVINIATILLSEEPETNMDKQEKPATGQSTLSKTPSQLSTKTPGGTDEN